VRPVDADTSQKYDLPTSGDKLTLQWRTQQWIIIFNANLDTSHPQSMSALRAKLRAAEVSRAKDKNKDERIADMAQYARDQRGEFEKLRKEIQERDKKQLRTAQGLGADSAIEVD
jgi:E3 ubiquitin-protein ligase RAD18